MQDTLSNSSICASCSDCGGDAALWSLPFQELPFVLLILTLVILLLVKRNKGKTLFWTLGLTIFLSISITLGNAQLKEEQHRNNEANEVVQNGTDDIKFFDKKIATDTEFTTLDKDDFESLESDGEFEEFEEFSDFEELDTTNNSETGGTYWSKLIRIIIALSATIIAGFLVKYEWGRKYKPIFLLTSLIYLGFYSGGCPCMISSFQDLILFLLGEPSNYVNLIWILGLVIITFFFGKVWCGWICHLGALQEFLYRPQIFKRFSKPKVQNTLKIIRIVVLIALLLQLIVTRTNLFIKIDPFKVAFNLFSVNIMGYVLLVLLLISSLFIYRPFCKTICPVGLVLGWVQKIPGASKLMVEPSCKKCNKCIRSCNYQAITNQGEIKIDNTECIRCGDCMGSCNDLAIKNFKK